MIGISNTYELISIGVEKSIPIMFHRLSSASISIETIFRIVNTFLLTTSLFNANVYATEFFFSFEDWLLIMNMAATHQRKKEKRTKYSYAKKRHSAHTYASSF